MQGLAMERQGSSDLAHGILSGLSSIGGGIVRGAERRDRRREFDERMSLERDELSLRRETLLDAKREKDARADALLDIGMATNDADIMEAATALGQANPNGEHDRGWGMPAEAWGLDSYAEPAPSLRPSWQESADAGEWGQRVKNLELRAKDVLTLRKARGADTEALRRQSEQIQDLLVKSKARETMHKARAVTAAKSEMKKDAEEEYAITLRREQARNEADASSKAARLAKINEGRKARGETPLDDLAQLGPMMTTERAREGRDAKADLLDDELMRAAGAYTEATGKPLDWRKADPKALLEWASDRKKAEERSALRKESDEHHAALSRELLDKKATTEEHFIELRARLSSKASRDEKMDEIRRLAVEHGELSKALAPTSGIKIAGRDKAIQARIAAIEKRTMELNTDVSPPAAAPTLTRDAARVIFDREVKARGIDPTGPDAERLAEDIKAGRVR